MEQYLSACGHKAIKALVLLRAVQQTLKRLVYVRTDLLLTVAN